MSTLVNCPKCRVEIESDSYYCDQCGVELYICPKCHLFGKGKRCTQCGQALVSAAQAVPASQNNVMAEKAMHPEAAPAAPVRMVCTSAGIRLGLGDGAVIGRRKGDYVSAFTSQGYVSGTHARLQKNPSGQWEIVDLDSTNGTFVNGHRLAPNAPATFHIGDVIRIANIDFKVE